MELVLVSEFDELKHEWWPRLSEIDQHKSRAQILEVGIPSVLSGATFGEFISSKLQVIVYWIVHLAQQDKTQSLRPWEQLNKKSRMASEGRYATVRVACEPSKYVCYSLCVRNMIEFFVATIESIIS